MNSKTAESLVNVLDGVLPGFREYVQSPENLFDKTSVHGVFAACSHFLRDHEVAEDAWSSLGPILNRIVGGEDERLSNAACTCFLENLAAPDHPLHAHLKGEALTYWKRWESAGERRVNRGDYPFAAVCTSDQALMADRNGVLVAAEPGERDSVLLTVGETYVILGERLGMYIVVNNMGSTSLHPKPYFRRVEGSGEEPGTIQGDNFVIMSDRTDWFSQYCQRIDEGVMKPEEPGVTYSCPCCGYPTLSERGGYEICPLCDWEDDGQDDPRADEVWGGPNGSYSLSQARSNFAAFGIMYSPDDQRTPDTQAVLEAKRAVCAAYDAIRSAGEGAPERLWADLREARKRLDEGRATFFL